VKVLVTGGRDYERKVRVFEVLDELHRLRSITKIVHGDATGADRLAKQWARSRGVPEQGYTAEWAKYKTPGQKNPAGHIRNRHMYKTEAPDLVIAFPGGNGTFGMCAIARAGRTELMLIDGGPTRRSAPTSPTEERGSSR